MSKENLRKKLPDEIKFKFDIRKVLKSEPIDSRNSFDIMVIRWGDGPKCKYVLEKRRVWKKEDGIKFRKLAGMTADDLDFIVANMDEIKRLLQEPPTPTVMP